jgi:uridine kinase
LISRFADLAEAIRRAPARCGAIRLVAIDGPGGAGKSVFAERLARHLGNAPVIHTDDFASWDNPVGWWGRLEDEVLGPVERDEWPVHFRAYDWDARRLGEWREIPAGDVILLEGVSSSRKAVASRLTLAVWIEAPRDRRLARGLERDGDAMRAQWELWMAEEDAHFASDRARDRADVIVDGAPSIPHDPEEAFVRLTART